MVPKRARTAAAAAAASASSSSQSAADFQQHGGRSDHTKLTLHGGVKVIEKNYLARTFPYSWGPLQKFNPKPRVAANAKRKGKAEREPGMWDMWHPASRETWRL